MKFVRNHAIGLLALLVALGGTAVAARPQAQTANTKVHIRQLQVPLSDQDTGTVKVPCRPGERVTGGGYRFGSPVDLKTSVVITNAPFNVRTWAVEITNNSDGPWNGVVQAYAMCAERR